MEPNWKWPEDLDKLSWQTQGRSFVKEQMVFPVMIDSLELPVLLQFGELETLLSSMILMEIPLILLCSDNDSKDTVWVTWTWTTSWTSRKHVFTRKIRMSMTDQQITCGYKVCFVHPSRGWRIYPNLLLTAVILLSMASWLIWHLKSYWSRRVNGRGRGKARLEIFPHGSPDLRTSSPSTESSVTRAVTSSS